MMLVCMLLVGRKGRLCVSCFDNFYCFVTVMGVKGGYHLNIEPVTVWFWYDFG